MAEALLTATRVARQRWQQRKSALGGPIEEVLPKLTLELSVLREDGTLHVRSPEWIDQLITPVHGVGYAHQGNWHYVLPEHVHSGQHDSPTDALLALFAQNNLPASTLQNEDYRLYRFLARNLF